MSSVMHTYPDPICYPVKGEGVLLYDKSGKEYLDFGTGIGVTSLGHAHPALVQVLNEQSQKLWHTSNWYGCEAREALAHRITKESFADSVFFCNSGLETFETAIKLARRAHYVQGNKEKYEIIGFSGGFHGRSMAGIFTQPSEKRQGFGPLADGYTTVDFCDIEALEATISEKTAAVIIEPVQGEAGIRVVSPEKMRAIRSLADANGFFVICDEVQCGMGKTGFLWAYEHSLIEPDIMKVSKALGGGFPVGAVLAKAHVAQGFTQGSHGTTFGGNPLAIAVARAVFDVISSPDMLLHVRETGKIFSDKIRMLIADREDLYAEQRGRGFMQGIVCRVDGIQIARALADAGLLVIPAAENVIRFLPPFVIGEQEIDRAIEKLSSVKI